MLMIIGLIFCTSDTTQFLYVECLFTCLPKDHLYVLLYILCPVEVIAYSDAGVICTIVLDFKIYKFHLLLQGSSRNINYFERRYVYHYRVNITCVFRELRDVRVMEHYKYGNCHFCNQNVLFWKIFIFIICFSRQPCSRQTRTTVSVDLYI